MHVTIIQQWHEGGSKPWLFLTHFMYFVNDPKVKYTQLYAFICCFCDMVFALNVHSESSAHYFICVPAQTAACQFILLMNSCKTTINKGSYATPPVSAECVLWIFSSFHVMFVYRAASAPHSELPHITTSVWISLIWKTCSRTVKLCLLIINR